MVCIIDMTGLIHGICSHTTYMHTTLRRGGVGRDCNKGEGRFSVVYECVVFIHYVCEGPGMYMYMHYVWGYGDEGDRSVCIVYACMLRGCVCSRCADSGEAVRSAYTTRYNIHATRNYAMLFYTAIFNYGFCSKPYTVSLFYILIVKNRDGTYNTILIC